ncbi:MAG: cytidylate kinase family protein [Gemmatimonadota bacterium]|jgi:cytidylate kinase
MPIITISRGTESGGARLAESLKERLGLKVISREVVMEAAKTYGVSEEDLLSSLQSPPGFWDKQAKTRQRYILAVQATLAGLAEGDDVVYHGLAGQLLFRELPNVLKVRLIAPKEDRVRAAMAHLDLSRSEAVKHIEEADEDRANWVRRVYDVDVTDPSLYDLVLNLGTMSMDTATEMVVDLVGRQEYRSTPETLRRTRDFALAVRVRAELSLKSEFPGAAAHVSVSEGIVTLDLPANLRDRAVAIAHFVGSVEGVEEVVDTQAEAFPPEVSAVTNWKTAQDLMLPLSGYPHVPQDLPIREALLALGASSVLSSEGHLVVPRYLLVLDEEDRLVGVINRRALLRGLIPQYASLKRASSVAAALPYSEALSAAAPLWSSLFSPAAVSAAEKPVRSVMVPTRVSVAHDDPVDTVVSSMLEHDVDLIPVTEGARTVGVVMMTDVFDNVSEYVLERGAK